MIRRIIAIALAVVFLLLPTASWGAVDPAVLDAFRRDGGTIVKAYAIVANGQQCWGTYNPQTKQIRIRIDAPESTLAHEIGHWLYHRQVWSGELQDMADKAFAQSPLRVCNDENFAIGYEMYVCKGLGGELGSFYRYIENATLMP